MYCEDLDGWVGWGWGGKEVLEGADICVHRADSLGDTAEMNTMTLCDPVDCMKPAGFLCPWDFPGKNTGAGCHFLLQGIFLTQGSNSSLCHWQADSLPLSHVGSQHNAVRQLYSN